jgi:hypothetical protein
MEAFGQANGKMSLGEMRHRIQRDLSLVLRRRRL